MVGREAGAGGDCGQGATAVELAARVRAGRASARDVVARSLEAIAARDGALGAFLHVDREGALAAAADIDRRVAAGEDPGPLAGVPVALKDNLADCGRPCTCASRALAGFHPPYSAHVVDRLRAAGAVIVGRTNMDEFAMGSSTENSGVRVTRNPWDPERVPGGSSGGSAAAVAAGIVPLALGSDTGGSIRQPAGFCGIVGMKPSYGLVSRYGLVAFASSLDQVGPMARTVEDAALLLQVIAGPDARDATCRREPVPDLLAACARPLRGLRLGVPSEYFATSGLQPEVREAVLGAVDRLCGLGAVRREISLPTLDCAVPAYYIIATAEASSNLARYDGVHYGVRAQGAEDIVDLFRRSRSRGFGREVKRRILLGTYVLCAGYYDAYYLRALRVRTRIAREFELALGDVDLVVSPTSPTTAFALGERTADPVAMYLSDIYTVSANLACLPAISLPCGRDRAGMPIGLQFTAARWREDLLLRAAAAWERAHGPPPSPSW